jgi:DNA-binding PadR family transcriptional regulator
MPLPRLTHRQYLIVNVLVRQSAPGRAIRDRLRAAGVKQSGPAFYQLMSGLEDRGFVSGWYEQQIVGGQIIRERHYKVLAAGTRALGESRSFYRRAASTRPGFAGG